MLEQMISEARERDEQRRRIVAEQCRQQEEETKAHYRQLLTERLIATFGSAAVAQWEIVIESTTRFYARLFVNETEVRLTYRQDRDGQNWQVETAGQQRFVRIVQNENTADKVLIAIGDLAGL